MPTLVYSFPLVQSATNLESSPSSLQFQFSPYPSSFMDLIVVFSFACCWFSGIGLAPLVFIDSHIKQVQKIDWECCKVDGLEQVAPFLNICDKGNSYRQNGRQLVPQSGRTWFNQNETISSAPICCFGSWWRRERVLSVSKGTGL